MKTLIFIPLLLCFLNLGYYQQPEVNLFQDQPLTGSWQTEQIRIQYIVDSHLVHEQELTPAKGSVYCFDGKTVRVTHPDGTTTQGTYAVVKAAEGQQVILTLPNATTTFTLIAVTPTRMLWQRDLEDVYYTEGTTQKSAERAIYTEVFKK